MARPWRIEFEGALYHVLSRGNQGQDIFTEPELSQQVKLTKAVGEKETLTKLAKALNCQVDHFRASLRISRTDKMNPDLMLYLLRQSGLYTNQQIGELFGLSYSSVGRRAAIARKRIQEDVALRKQIQQLNDLINV